LLVAFTELYTIAKKAIAKIAYCLYLKEAPLVVRVSLLW